MCSCDNVPIKTNLNHNLDSQGKHRVVSSQGGNRQWYNILGPTATATIQDGTFPIVQQMGLY